MTKRWTAHQPGPPTHQNLGSARKKEEKERERRERRERSEKMKGGLFPRTAKNQSISVGTNLRL